MYVEKYHSYTYHASALVLVSCTIQLEIHLAVRYDILEGTNQTRRDQTYVEHPEDVSLSAQAQPKCMFSEIRTAHSLFLSMDFRSKLLWRLYFNDKLQYIITPVALGKDYRGSEDLLTQPCL